MNEDETIAAKGRTGSIIIMIESMQADKVIEALLRIPERLRKKEQ